MASVLCGVDLGGSKLGIGLVAEDGRILDRRISHDHVSRRPDDIVEAMAEGIGELLARKGLGPKDLRGVGVGTAGHLRFRDGVVIAMSNLEGFAGYPLRDRLRSRLGTRVVVDNDANAQAWGEHLHGAGVGFRSLVFITISTQIGAGIVLDGRLFRGATGTAGEFGHSIVEATEGLPCPCGNRGCLIAHASGVAIPGAVRRRILAGERSSLVGTGDLAAATLDGEFIARGLALGDPLCEGVVDEFAAYIGLGAYNIFQALNPEAIVLGGGLMNWGPRFLMGIRARFRALVRGMAYEEPAILPGSCADSGIVGAASLVLVEDP